MNYYYLIAGSLSLFLSIAHSVWGEKIIVPGLKKSAQSQTIEAGFYIAWHQIAMTLFVSGAALIITAILNTVNTNIIGLLAGAVSAGNFLVFILICLIKYPAMFKRTLPQTILFVVMITMTFLGLNF